MTPHKQKKIGLSFILIYLMIPSLVSSQTLDISKLIDISKIGTTTEEATKDIKAISDKINKEMVNLAAKQSTSLILLPKYPKPNEDVSVSLYGSLIETARADISWYIDDELVLSGIGIEEFNFKTKDTGEFTKIKVVIESIDGVIIEKTINITPIEIEILWEADTYTPPFYKGKALLSPNSPVKIVAIPKIKEIDGNIVGPKSFVYVWESAIYPLGGLSGFGKNTFYTTAPRPFRDNEIYVSVSNRDGSVETKSRFEMQLTSPFVLFYKEHPIEGVLYEKTLDDGFDLQKKELNIRAVPYFFANEDKKSGNLTYKWLLNGNDTVSSSENLTLRQDGASGTANIAIFIENISKNFQSASNSFKLKFGNLSSFRF